VIQEIESNMSRMNNRALSESYVYTSKNDNVFTYVGKDKTKWHKLESVLAKDFREKEIGYLRNPMTIRALRAQPVPVPHIPIPPGGETENQREERRRRQDREDKEYSNAHDRWIKDERKLQKDFAVAITIIQNHVSEEINTDLQRILVNAEQQAATEEAKYNQVYNRLISKYGPYDQKDIEHMRNIMLNLNMDKLGAREAMHQFNNMIMSMTLTPQRDGNNVIMRAPVQPALPAPLGLNPINWQIIQHYQQTQDAIAAVVGIEGPALNHRPTDDELKTYLK